MQSSSANFFFRTDIAAATPNAKYSITCPSRLIATGESIHPLNVSHPNLLQTDTSQFLNPSLKPTVPSAL